MLSSQTSAKASFIYIVIVYWGVEKKIDPQCEPGGLHFIYKQNSPRPNNLTRVICCRKMRKQASREPVCVWYAWLITVKHRWEFWLRTLPQGCRTGFGTHERSGLIWFISLGLDFVFAKWSEIKYCWGVFVVVLLQLSFRDEPWTFGVKF